MTKTVIGIFDSANEAQKAVQQLGQMGFTREQIDISTQGNRDYNSLENTSDNNHDHDGFGQHISRFFSSLFDSDEETTKYSTVAKQGVVVAVQAESDTEAESAADIMDEEGAVNVDEHARNYNISNSSSEIRNSNSTSNRTSF
jgi:hypothetical protein